ncbi:hypothetical protein ASE35_18205 [Lysobacter sp. Root916]|uniref:hypothetical protein n=1 Tax=Lysobacter sp. Root916 TaxID=1736606 RepID=UPI000713257B|nr:hypothetical protein [Lysobacter sp. Root916]KRD30064.1 hypothetical protein ASE35_18205 [Lysobacter sp. Root916]
MQLRYILIALFGLAALIGAYFLGRGRSPEAPAAAASIATARGPQTGTNAASSDPVRMMASLPSRDVPLKRIFNDLRSRADAGDVAAATRLYQDLRTCASLDNLEWFLTRVADETLADKIDGTSAQALERYRVQLEAVESHKQAIQKTRALCDGLDRGMLDSQLSSLQRAAQLGEAHARACYLASGPGYDARGLMRHPEWIQEYRSSVKSMVDAGMAAGDWKVVDILRRSYEPGADGMLAGTLGSDAVQYYRYLKLYRLGAERGRAADMDRKLALAAARIQPEQLADADRWAQEKFQNEFSSSNSTDSTAPGWDPCSFATSQE